jgi:hypothetical protein
MTPEEEAALKSRVAELEAKVSPPKSDFVPMSDAEWRDQMHQMRERRMAHASNFHPDDLRAMEAACPTDLVKGIALRDARAPTGPSSAGTSGTVTRVSSNPGIPGSNTGWVNSRPLGPPEGLRYVDAQLDAQDAKDRHERIVQEAKMRAALKR